MAALPNPPPESATAPTETQTLVGGRFRAVWLAILWCIPVCYACVNQEVSHIFSLLTAPISVLMVMVLANLGLRRFAPKQVFTTADLVIIYSVVAVAGAVSAEWIKTFHALTHAYPLAAETNPTVKNIIMPNMPDWLAVKDLAKVQDMSGGGRDLAYTNSKVGVYWLTYVAWGAIFLSACMAMLCLNSLMRGMWTKEERLTFPLIQLPVAMSENNGAGAMWRSKYMWMAFGIMFAIDMLNGLNFLYPSLPNVPTKDIVNIRDLFTDPPLSNMGSMPLAIYPFMAAIGLLMPSDLLFSIIFFYFLRKITHVVLAANGIPQDTFSGTYIAPGPPYFDEQSWGGVIALFISAIWMARSYLKRVWSDIKTGASSEDDGVRHRWAFTGLIVAFSFIVVVGTLGDLPPWYTAIYFALFLAFSTVVTRIRAALGPPTHEFAFFGPNSIMGRFLGTSWLSDKNIVWLNNVFIFMNRIHRTHVMPYQLESMKMGQLANIRQRKMFWYVTAAMVVSFFLAMHLYTALVYRTGGHQRWTDAYTYTQNMVNGRKGPDLLGIAMTFLGFAIVVGLDAVRFRFPAFPLHPVGYVLSMNFGVDYYWFGLMIALLVKNFVQRYYGLRGYDKLRNVALGILLGEYAAETIWMTMALITKQSSYTISFNERALGAQ
ncbi:MAG: hypothetical protein KF784_05135 [Fimbriimonadaceae bacterium]|nr:hypothetical protein [Fimbriimonadaceae bacterium]